AMARLSCAVSVAAVGPGQQRLTRRERERERPLDVLFFVFSSAATLHDTACFLSLGNKGEGDRLYSTLRRGGACGGGRGTAESVAGSGDAAFFSRLAGTVAGPSLSTYGFGVLLHRRAAADAGRAATSSFSFFQRRRTFGCVSRGVAGAAGTRAERC
ncbi:uncharacterized protein Tco025E_09105, partial [Trypanosoma conorhini]